MPLNHARRGGARLRAAVVVLSAAAWVVLYAAAAGAAPPARPDLTASIAADPAQVPLAGGLFSLLVDVANVGAAPAQEVSVTLRPPAGSTLAGEATSSWECNYAKWRCRYAGELAPGGAAESLRIPLRLPAGGEGTVLPASVTAATESREASTDNNTARTAVTYADVLSPDLAVFLSANPTEVAVGATIDLQVDVSNRGRGPAPDAAVTLAIPLTMHPVSPGSGGSDWDCSFRSDASFGYWDCVHGPLAADEFAAPILLAATLDAGTPGEVLDFFASGSTSVTEQNETWPNSDAASATVVAPAT
jgi:hypothetical protein